MANREFRRGNECPELRTCGWVRSEGRKECDTCTRHGKTTRPFVDIHPCPTRLICKSCGFNIKPIGEEGECPNCSYKNTPKDPNAA